jgi:hypothetical protein
MRKYAEEHDYGKTPTLNLVASYFGEKIVITSDLAALYMRLGFNITKVTEVIIDPTLPHPHFSPTIH